MDAVTPAAAERDTERKVGVIFFPAFDWAISPTHPEREERLLYAQDQLREEGVFDLPQVEEFKPRLAEHEDIARTQFCIPSVEAIITESHRVAAGGAMRIGDLVMDGRVDRAYAMVRPPGHHARKLVHGNRGFCSINNEAILIEHLREHHGVERIAVVDTDCHHGDGTQDIYWHDPEVLFISVHQDGRTLFPGSGFVGELGGPNARGRTINLPLPPGTADEGFLQVIERVVLPILADFQPELVINSVGQDNHYTDPITHMNLSARGYARLNEMLAPDLCVLEGGYAIQGALPYINLGILLAMAGLDTSGLREPDFDPQKVAQDPRIPGYVDELCRVALEHYHQPPPLEAEADEGDLLGMKQQVFYDTDNILEQQLDAVRLCSQCAGLRRIESVSTKNPSCLAIEIPHRACADCRAAGQALIERARADAEAELLAIIDRPGRSTGVEHKGERVSDGK